MAIRLLALVCLAGAALAGPLKKEVRSQCSTQCPTTSEEKFHYRSDSKYVYRYRGIDYVSAAGSRKVQKSEITAQVEIDVVEKCEMALRLTDVQYQGERPLSQDLIEKLSVPLYFSWVDGNIQDICASSDESQESENVKRGILSAIVNTMSDLRSPSQHQEVDSLGSCETKYVILETASGSVTIKKEKSLKTCDNRHSGLTAFPYNPYQSPESKIQSLPIFTDEKSECQQVIKDRVIQRVLCKANAQIQPLSQYDSLVEFQGEIQLQLQRVEKSSLPRQRPATDKKSIRYNYDQEQDMQSREKEATDILTELCRKTDVLLHPGVSKLYLRLVTVLKGLPADKVHSIYESLQRQELCQSPKTLDIFLDALPMAGTEGAIKLMVHLLKTKQVSSLKAKIWPASFALIQNPNAEAISAVLPLVSDEEKSRPALLGLSAMIYKVCSSSDCDHIESVRNAVSALQQTLGSQCSSENEDEVISVLKAFGNMGHHGQAEETIIQCATSSEKPINVRLAAVDAFRRYSKEIPSALIQLYSSPNENFEVRIAALATAVKKCDSRLLEAIQKVVKNDQDVQVVAYTLSLVKNLKESSSPLKQNVKEALQQIQVNRTVGYWENSKHIEFSAFNVPTNLGASLESDVIHAQGTKIPRSFSSKLDIDVFGKNVNIFELGVRAEGLEKAMKRLFRMDEPAKQQKSWFALTSRSSEEADKPEISFYLRTMETEFLDMTIQDLTSMGNMVQFADVVNKLSQSKKVDFAHSFVFLNTKVIIPSVTGRSYVFGMTGSASVGLTADGKFDIINLMSSPRNCDIGGRIQPSANVEFTTTLGIHSEKTRPDIKIVTSFHSEGDIGAKIRVKDSHMAEARLDMPSEKIQVLKVSTELFEVDANDNEKPIIEEMQTKIDHCVSTLKKPLGVQFCAKLETPRPFISRDFPYARGLGNLELSISKAEPSMRGYFMSAEMPKRQSDHMTYRFIMDTPGSSVQRKIHANLDWRKSSSEEREFKLDVQSPFKDVSASGSYVWQSNMVQGSLNVIMDKSRRYSMKAVMEMSRSTTEMTIKPTLQWTLPESEPVSLSGSVIYSNSRKQLVKIDLRSSKPGVKPYVFTGNLMKEGRLGISKRDQWKMSADVVVKTPFITAKVHSTGDKITGQSQGVSSTFSIDYETQRSGKQSLKFSSKVQQSSSKISAAAEFETTQNPKYNWFLNWDVQGSPKNDLKNDIMLKYGRNPDRTYIHISQSSQIRDHNSLSEGKISLKIPQLSIDSELKVALALHMKETGTFHVESDLRYKSDQHAKLLFQLKQLSKKPVKMAIKAQLEYPDRKLMYKDEIEETSPNVYEGRSIMQWQSNQQASLQYKYKRLSDRSTFHHEMESILKTSFMQSQIASQASLKATKENMEIQAFVQQDKQLVYKLEAELNRKGQSHVSISSPVAEGKVEISNESQKKSGKLDFLLKLRKPQRIAAFASLDLSSKKAIAAELSWNADQNPSQKVSVSAEIDVDLKRSPNSYNARCNVQILDIVSVAASCSGNRGSQSLHQSKLDVSGSGFEDLSIIMRNEIATESIRSTINYRKGQKEKAAVELSGKYVKQSSGADVQASVSLKSPDHSFEDKELFLRHSYVRTRSATNLQSTIHLKLAAGKKHEATVEYSSEAKMSRKLRVVVDTPYKYFSHQEISFSHRREQDKNTFNVAVQCSGKEVALSAVLAKTDQGRSITCSLQTPLKVVRDVTVYASFENQRLQKQVESYVEINGKRKFATSCSYISGHEMRKIQSSFKLHLTSEFEVTIQAEKDRNSLNHEFVITKDSSNLMSYRISHSNSGESFNSFLEVKSRRNSLVDIKLMKEVKSSFSKYTLKVNKPFTPISVTIQTTKADGNSHNLILDACKESTERLCYIIKGYYKREKDVNKYIRPRKITLDVEKVFGQGSRDHLCSIHYLLTQQGQAIKSKFILDVKEKKYGYEVNMKKRTHEDKPCELDISFFMPPRTMRYTLSAVHNPQRSVFELTAFPDISSPSSKIVFEVKKKWDSKHSELTGEIKLNHPALKMPVSAKYSISNWQSRYPTAGKFELDYSQNSRDRLTLELSSQSQRNQPEKKVFVCKLYTQGKDLDVTLKASAHRTNHKDVYTYEWSWQSREGLKSVTTSVQLSNKISGRPQTIDIRYTCPHSQYDIAGHTEWTSAAYPSKLHLTFSEKGHSIGEIQYDQSDSCASLEIKRSTPLLKNRVCINKSEQNKLTLLSIECYCQDNKCLDISIDLDPSKSHVANIGIKWRKEQYWQTLKSLKDVVRFLEPLPYREMKEEIYQKAEILYSPLKHQVLIPLSEHLVEQVRQISEEQTEELEAVKKQLRQFVQQLAEQLPNLPTIEEFQKKCEEFIEWLRKEVERYLDTYAPEWLRDLIQSLMKAAEEYFHHVCQRGTFCHQLKQAYQRRGMQQVQRLLKSVLEEKIEELQMIKSKKIRAAKDWISDTWEETKEFVCGWAQNFKVIFDWAKNTPFVEKWSKYVEDIREYVQNKAEDYLKKLAELIDDIMDTARKNEDFRVLESLVKDAKDELVHTAQQLNVKVALQPLRNTILYKYPQRWLREKINVTDFNIKTGNVQVQLHHPLDKSKVQLLRNILVMAKNKYQSYMK